MVIRLQMSEKLKELHSVLATELLKRVKDPDAKSADLNNFIYPLIDWDIEKEDILSWWEDQPFDLEIPEHLGNCVWCWKKCLDGE